MGIIRRGSYLKGVFVLICLALAPSIQAVELFVEQDEKTLFKFNETMDLKNNVGQISVSVFDEAGIEYEGGDYGIKMLFNLKNEIEIISDKEMKAYGWCFSIDGVIPETMADETYLSHQKSKIVWFYGYAHYLEGEWIGQCLTDES